VILNEFNTIKITLKKIIKHQNEINYSIFEDFFDELKYLDSDF
jgi:hypothetical protein